MSLNADQDGPALQLQWGQTVAILCDQMQRFTEAPSGSGCTLIDSPLSSEDASVITGSNSISSISSK
jgi:hypothetical protein